MAVLYITEYATVPQTGSGPLAMSSDPPLAQYTVAIGASSAVPAAPNLIFQPATKFIRLHTDAICSVYVAAYTGGPPTQTQLNGATAPAATATMGRMAANQTEYRGVSQGSAMTVAVITNS